MSESLRQSVSVAIALGSNLGDRAANIHTAIAMLDRAAQIHVIALSDLVDTDPVGVTDQPRFLNAAALLHTTLDPLSLLSTCHAIEKALGRDREREQRWGPRTIDLDMLIYGQEVIQTPGLTIPHPRMLERGFVLVPLHQIAPEMLIPGVNAATPLNVPVKVKDAWQRLNRIAH